MDSKLLLASLIGLISGTLSGFLGIGGGIIMVPAFIFFLDRDVKTAVGTSLAIIIPTAIVGVRKHHQAGFVDWKLMGSVVILAMVGSYFGAWLVPRLQSRVIEICFGLLMIAVGIKMLWPRTIS